MTTEREDPHHTSETAAQRKQGLQTDQNFLPTLPDRERLSIKLHHVTSQIAIVRDNLLKFYICERRRERFRIIGAVLSLTVEQREAIGCITTESVIHVERHENVEQQTPNSNVQS